ncbi:MAG: hypothetical protein Q4F11_04455, partial [Eubacteriales bacterium]|nr:hypothetical protein [Eubacteriales bacterium]
MNEKKLRRKNLALRIMIFIGTYAGVNAVRGFFSIRMAVGNSDDYTILAMSSSLALDYLTFLLMSAAVFIMNFFVKQALSKKEWIIRAVVMGISVVLIWYSAPSISYIIYMGASRYSENLLIYPVDIKFAESYISSNLWTVFSYMVSAAVYVVLAVMS